MSNLPWVCDRCGNTNEQHEKQWEMRQDERDAERAAGYRAALEAVKAEIEAMLAPSVQLTSDAWYLPLTDILTRIARLEKDSSP